MNEPGFFKYVIYGDSVCENHKIKFKFYDIEYEMTLDSTWNFLKNYASECCHSESRISDKEYITFYNNAFKILTYENKKIIWTTPKYFMRHKINKEVAALKLEDEFELHTTLDHSLFDENFEIKTPFDPTLQFIPRLKKKKLFNFNKNKLEMVRIINKFKTNYNGYVYDFEVENTHNFIVDSIIVHNTDSLYINIPSLKPKTSEEAIESAAEVSKGINNLITEYINNNVLKKLGVDKTNNRTSFKTELIASAILLLDIKKYYAYKKICEKNHVFDPPVIEYKGIPVVRSDVSKISQKLLRSIIEEVALNEDFKLDMTTELRKVQSIYYSQLKKAIEELDVHYIGTPGKWKSSVYKVEPYHLTGMKLMNSISKQEIFKEGIPCYSVPINLNAPAQIKNYIAKLENNKYYLDSNISFEKLNYLSFPYIFDKLKVMKLMNEFNISIELETVWNIVYSKTAERISDIIKTSSLET